MKKEIKELKKIVEEMAKIEKRSLKEAEKMTKKIRDERRKPVEFNNVIKNGDERKCDEKSFKNGFCRDLRIPKKMRHGGNILPA